MHFPSIAGTSEPPRDWSLVHPTNGVHDDTDGILSHPAQTRRYPDVDRVCPGQSGLPGRHSADALPVGPPTSRLNTTSGPEVSCCGGSGARHTSSAVPPHPHIAFSGWPSPTGNQYKFKGMQGPLSPSAGLRTSCRGRIARLASDSTRDSQALPPPAPRKSAI